LRCVQGLAADKQAAPKRGPMPEGLGWDPLDLSDPGTSIPDILRRCDWVDHGVPAVSHMQARGSLITWC
jgi:hypothetical protein